MMVDNIVIIINHLIFLIIFHTTKTLDLSAFLALLCSSEPEAAGLYPKVLLSIGKLSKVDTLERLNPTCSGIIPFTANKKKLCSGILHSFLFSYKNHLYSLGQLKIFQVFIGLELDQNFSFCYHVSKSNTPTNQEGI